jgi:hypothetical protein
VADDDFGSERVVRRNEAVSGYVRQADKAVEQRPVQHRDDSAIRIEIERREVPRIRVVDALDLGQRNDRIVSKRDVPSRATSVVSVVVSAVVHRIGETDRICLIDDGPPDDGLVSPELNHVGGGFDVLAQLFIVGRVRRRDVKEALSIRQADDVSGIAGPDVEHVRIRGRVRPGGYPTNRMPADQRRNVVALIAAE